MPFAVCVCSRLHPEGGESQLSVHPQKLPPEVSLCGKMDMLDRMLVKLIAAGHKVAIPAPIFRQCATWGLEILNIRPSPLEVSVVVYMFKCCSL